MDLKLRLAWYDRNTGQGEGVEFSQDFGDDVSIMDKLGLSIDHDINNGEFDIANEWLAILQPFFMQSIDLGLFNYQISFNYKS